MRAKFYKIKFLKVLLVIIAFFLFDLSLNFTVYNPTFITPIYNFFLNHHIISNEESGYPLESVHTLNWGLYSGSRATVIGTVEYMLKSGDGDWHINIQSKNETIVAEIIPEYPLPVPSVGEKVRIWGITRYDIAHRWWELHPVIGWKKLTIY